MGVSPSITVPCACPDLLAWSRHLQDTMWMRFQALQIMLTILAFRLCRPYLHALHADHVCIAEHTDHTCIQAVLTKGDSASCHLHVTYTLASAESYPLACTNLRQC